MANNVMQEMRVYDGYLVCLDLEQISPATAPEILPATSLACVGFSLEKEMVMQHSRDNYFPQLENQGINPVGGTSKSKSMHLHKQLNTCTQRDKGIVNPFTVNCKGEI